jgi:hypothetical protein
MATQKIRRSPCTGCGDDGDGIGTSSNGLLGANMINGRAGLDKLTGAASLPEISAHGCNLSGERLDASALPSANSPFFNFLCPDIPRPESRSSARFE